MSKKKHEFETKLISQDRFLDDKTKAVNPSVYYSSTFHQEQFDSFGPFDYTRSGNPTRNVLEDTIAELEGGDHGFAFASGMAAISVAYYHRLQKERLEWGR